MGQAEMDVQLMANRLARLKDEEKKAVRKVEMMRTKAQDTISNKQRNYRKCESPAVRRLAARSHTHARTRRSVRRRARLFVHGRTRRRANTSTHQQACKRASAQANVAGSDPLCALCSLTLAFGWPLTDQMKFEHAEAEYKALKRQQEQQQYLRAQQVCVCPMNSLCPFNGACRRHCLLIAASC